MVQSHRALEAGDGGCLAQVLEVLANDRARAHQMGMRGREMVERKFDGRRTADLLLEQVRAAAR